MIRPRIAGGDLWMYYLGFALARIGSVAVLPVVAHVLGPHDYGYFEATVSVMFASMVIGDAGVGSAIVRFADQRRRPGGPMLLGAAQAQFVASLVAFAIAAAPVLVFAPPRTSAVVVLVALLLFTVIEGFNALGAGLLRVEERNRAYLATATVRLVTAISVGAVGAVVGGVGGALFGIAVAGTSFAAVAVRAIVRAGRFAAAEVRRARRSVLRYSLPLMLTSLMTWTLSLSDRLFLKVFVSPLELATYAASYRTGSVIGLFVTAPLGLAWIPAARRALSAGRLAQETERWSLIAAVAALGGGSILVALSPVAVPLLFGDGFDPRPAVVGAVAAGGWASGFYIFVATEILMSDSTRRLVPVMAFVVSLNLGLNWLLISTHGGDGAAVATLVSYAALPAATALAVSRESLRWALRPGHLVPVLALLAALVGAAIHPLACLPGLLLAAPFAIREIRGD
jgi:O-antigen/teichoic acid export membrane protein